MLTKAVMELLEVKIRNKSSWKSSTDNIYEANWTTKSFGACEQKYTEIYH